MFKTILFLIVALFGFSFAEVPNGPDLEVLHDPKDLTTMEHGELFKRAPMTFQSVRGKKYSIDIEDLDKRAPFGFHSVRGKKAMFEEDYNKRAPMDFQVMRGKKSLEEVLDDIDKRTSMGFQGSTRGEQMYLLEYPEEYEKRALPMGFLGIRGEKETFPVEWEKRAPIRFQGMRENGPLYEKRAMGLQGIPGREYINDNYLNFIDSIDYKRAPMGFQGMRGKKDGGKRAPLGFQGMRGKRNVLEVYGIYGKARPAEYEGDASYRRDGVSSYQFEKRSPFRYFGVRGKKNPRWEIRGKFVGVRGKRWATAPYVDSSSLKNVFDNNLRIDPEKGSTVALDVQ